MRWRIKYKRRRVLDITKERMKKTIKIKELWNLPFIPKSVQGIENDNEHFIVEY